VAAADVGSLPVGVIAADVVPAAAVVAAGAVVEAPSGEEFPPQALSITAPNATPPPPCRKRLRLTVDSLIADLLLLVKT